VPVSALGRAGQRRSPPMGDRPPGRPMPSEVWPGWPQAWDRAVSCRAAPLPSQHQWSCPPGGFWKPVLFESSSSVFRQPTRRVVRPDPRCRDADTADGRPLHERERQGTTASNAHVVPDVVRLRTRSWRSRLRESPKIFRRSMEGRCSAGGSDRNRYAKKFVNRRAWSAPTEERGERGERIDGRRLPGARTICVELRLPLSGDRACFVPLVLPHN